MEEKISREELVKIYNIEIEFFNSLEDSGLLKTETKDNTKYLLYEELPLLEMYANFYYDLDVNIPGIEVIQNLLYKINDLQTQNRQLINKFYLISKE